MCEGAGLRDLSPTSSRWFALRRWRAGHPAGAWLATIGLVAFASLVVHTVGRETPAPFLPFYPAMMVGALLGGRRMGYAAALLSLASAATLMTRGAALPGISTIGVTLLISLLVSAMLIEVLAQLSTLAEALRRRELALSEGTTELLAQEARLSAALSELEALYDEAPIGLGFLDRELRFVRINAALAEMNGFSVDAHIGKSVWDLVLDLRASAEPMLRRVIESNEVIKGVELSGETPAQPGVRRDWREMFYPVHDSAGAVQGLGIFCEEVTEAKRAQERERLLTREVDHRAKNLLTVIQSVLKLTRSTGSIDEFKAAVTGRIQSLGRVNTLLAQNRWEAVHLGELVRQELDPFGPAVRIGAISDTLRLAPNVAQAVSMILHELATNSVKHGALSDLGTGPGEVAFACVIEGGEEGAEAAPNAGAARLKLSWTESGGPPVAVPERRGFGTSLIRTAVTGMLAGELDYDLRPEGLHCVIRFPLHRPQHQAARPDSPAGTRSPDPAAPDGGR